MPIEPCTVAVYDCMDLFIQSAPLADAGPDISLCEGEPFYIIFGNSSNSSFCFWTSSGNGIFSDPYGSYIEYFPTPMDFMNGYVTLCLVCEPISPCFISSYDCMTITFIPSPLITLNEQEMTCEALGQYCFDFVYADHYSSLNWETSGDGYFDDPTAESPCYFFGIEDIAMGYAELCITAEPLYGCGETLTKCMNLYIIPDPLSEVGPDATVCEGENYYFVDAFAIFYESIMWSGGQGIFEDPMFVNTYYSPTPDETGTTIELCLSATSGMCGIESIDCMELFIQPKPTVNAGADTTICEDQTVLLNGVSQNTSNCYWLSSGNGYFINNSILNTEYIPSFMDIMEEEVTLCLICEAIDPCAFDVMSCLDVTFTPLPMIWVGMDESICEGDSFNPMAIVVENVSEILWSTNGDGVFDDNTIFNPVYYPGVLDIENGMVDLCVEGYPISPCEFSSIGCMTLYILKNPEVYAGADATICEDQGYFIEDAFAENYQNIIWQVNEGSFDNPSSPNPYYFPPPEFFFPGIVLISLEAEPLFPCSVFAADFMELVIMENPEVMVGEDVTICEGESTEVWAGAIMASAWSWFTMGSGTFANPLNEFTIYFPSEEDIQNGYATLCFHCEPIYPCSLFAGDCMNIEITKNAIVDAGGDINIPLDGQADLSGIAENFEYSGWETTGDGVFIDPMQLTTSYLPGPDDISSTQVTLILFAQSIAPCNLLISDSLELFIGKEHLINLNSGWNGFSTYLLPFNNDMEELMSPIQNNLVIMQNFTQLYWPGYNINTIGSFNSSQGYSIKVNQNCVLPIIGKEQESTFSFVSGWNIMPVLTNCDVPVFEFLPEMGPAFILAYEIGGNGILWPAQGIYNLLAFKPGKAYMVKTSQAKSFTFSECDNMKKGNLIETKKPYPGNSPWVIPSPNPGYHIIALSGVISDEKFYKGDLIAAFTETGLCAGFTVLQDEPTALLVNADDITTAEIDGFIELEKMNFKLFKPKTNEILPLAISFDDAFADHDGRFVTNGISAIKALQPVLSSDGLQAGNIRIHPNPTTGLLQIRGIDGDYLIEIFNAVQEKIYTMQLSCKDQLDLSDFPKGIYLIKITTNDFSVTKKVVVN